MYECLMSVINNKFINEYTKMRELPFPYLTFDNFIEYDFAVTVQDEILHIPKENWDRYDNPLEQKYTLRDKYNFPCNLKILFNELTSDAFVSELSKIVGYKLKLDDTRNFWGVHKYENGDKLDIHVDAGIHPTMGLKKQVTLGIYLSHNWKEPYGCNLEIWTGENSSSNNSKIFKKVDSISPLFNRLILFTCNDYSWHGNPEPAVCPENSIRIFVTLSYLSENYEDKNKRIKAFFVKRPNDENDAEKDKFRLLRADPNKYMNAYIIH